MRESLLSYVKTLSIVTVQSALLFIAMLLAFLPFAHAPGVLGITGGYLVYSLYPVLLYLLLIVAHRGFNRLSVADLRCSWWRLLAGIVAGVAIGAIAVLASVALIAFWLPEVSLELSGQSGSPQEWVILLANVWQTAFSEEFLFRGFLLFTLLHRGIRQHSAVMWSTLIFTCVHFAVKPPWWLFSTAAAGALLGYLYVTSANIGVPVGCHLAINLVFGLINRGILLQLNGAENHLLAVMISQCVVYLVIAQFVMLFHRPQVRAGGMLELHSGTLLPDEAQI